MARMLVKDENYLTIQGWMVTQLELSGNQLLVYAIIYGFSQDGGWFTGSQQYLSDWTNSTKRTIRNSLKSLLDSGHIEKLEYENNGVTFCKYRVVNFPSGEKFSAGEEKISSGVGKNFPGGEEKISANNIDNNIENNIEDNIDTDVGKTMQDIISTPKKKKPEKAVYGEYQNVKLTPEEYDKLMNEYGVEKGKGVIRFLDEYIEDKPSYKSKSHYLAIRRWVADAWDEKHPKPRIEEKWSDFLMRGD